MAPSAEYLIEASENYISRFHIIARPQFDASQDYDQVRRVLGLSNKILAAERDSRPEISYDSTIVTLSALLYSLVAKHGIDNDLHTPLSFLLEKDCPPEIAHAVHEITNVISFSREKQSPMLIQSILHKHPELAIVQDAHRLTSIGATGIARFFTFEGAAKEKNNLLDTLSRHDLQRCQQSKHLDHTLKHQLERCDQLEGMMKTQEGRRMAAVRTKRLKMFGSWWEDEEQLKD